ncbi:MAG TPA: mechanosensitive ion channel family protein [Terriglobales bacterium]
MLTHIPTRLIALLPTMVTALVLVAVLALVMALLTRWLRGVAPAGTTRAAGHLAANIRAAVAAAGFLAVLAILARGAGGAARLGWPQISRWATGPGLRILFIFAGAYILLRITHYFVAYLEDVLTSGENGPGAAPDLRERYKRIETLGRLLRALAIIVILGMALLMALREANMDITPILTGAGVAGVAIGFGAQTVVKDLIAGIFLILENQIRVGDVITINGKTGLVETIRLRILVLRATDGTVYVFQNGSITEYANLTKDYSYAVLEVSVAYKEDVARVTHALQQIGEELQHDPAYASKILAPLEILGVESLSSASVSIKARMKTAPVEQWAVTRELRRRVKMRFEKDSIALV